MTWLISTAALASALMGGIFFAFSSFVMPALGRIPPREAIRAMQRINIDVFHWTFVAAFFGTPLLCVTLAAAAILHPEQPRSSYLLAGSSVYLVGCLLVTGAGNVPLNNRLAQVEAETANAELEWSHYAPAWVRWNHARTAACLASAAAFVAALVA